LSHVDPFCFTSEDTIQTYTSVKEQIHSIDFQSETVGEIQDDDQSFQTQMWILTQSLFVFVSVSGLKALLARDKEIQEQFVLMTSL